ncbi:MAG: nickel-responsive transcriptional regulator NikR [Bacteroidales bacterium]|nr:nickel-responsive transcriptional regulator NikR [Bacteroidales bacterium]MCB9013820.1 nickel-responsive transcriptional regulator NikR [Bacteroidales bacterium]
MKRFGVSLESDLLDELDEMVNQKRFTNRSQAIRFLIKKNLVEEKWDNDMEVTGAIVINYDHHIAELHAKVNRLQHEYHCLILSGQHIHIDDHSCIEVIAVKGNAGKIIKLSNKFKALKGIKHGELVMSGSN